MRFTAPQPDLAAAAQWIARQLPEQPLYPTLMGACLHAEDGKVTLAGFDGETATRATLVADVDTPGTLHLPARLLADALVPLGKCDVTIDDATEQGTALATTSRTRTTLPTLDVSDAPTPPTGPAETGVVEGANLATAYKRVRAAVSPKATGTFAGMSGVRLKNTADGLQVAATDSYRIAQAWVPWSTPPPEEVEAMAVVPDKALAPAVAALAAGETHVALPTDGTGTARLSGSGHHTCATLLDPGTYPHQIDAVVPHQFTGEAEFAPAEAADAIRQVTAVSAGTRIRLRLTRNKGVLHARGRGATAGATFDIDWSGDDFEAFWNPRYFTDGLSALTGTARMQVTSPRTPALLSCPADGAYRYTIMPINPDAT